jgi:plasmid rolling circle replication initiator protein Rep
LPGVDERWTEKKFKNLRLAYLYDQCGYYAYANRARWCATWLQFLVGVDGRRELFSGNFCKLRLCPICISRRARKSAFELSRILDTAGEEGFQFIFLTLTKKNVEGDKLGEGVADLISGWRRLIDQRQVERSICGWYRAIEITRNRDNGTYHPHIHAILAVKSDYFKHSKDLYITHDGWVAKWQKALKVEYRPSVHIEKTRGGDGRKATLEAAKYACKDTDYIDPSLDDDTAVKIVQQYTDALQRRRLTAFGGILKEIAQRLEMGDSETGDLSQIGDEKIRPDIAELVEDYHWNLGAGDFVLADRRINPLRVEVEKEADT